MLQGQRHAAKPHKAGGPEEQQHEQDTSSGALVRVLEAVPRLAPMMVMAQRFMDEEWLGLLQDAGVPPATEGDGAAGVCVFAHACVHASVLFYVLGRSV